MSTKSTIRHQDREGELPGWQIYEDLFEKDDVVYLELDGVQIDVTMIGGSLWTPPAGTVLLRLPTGSARQLGLVAHDWTRGHKWDEDRNRQVLDRLRRIADAKRRDRRSTIKRALFLRVTMAVGAVWFLARIAFPRSECRKAESALGAIDSVLAGKPKGRAKTRSIVDLAGSLKPSVAGVSVDDLKALLRPSTKARKDRRREESARLQRLVRVLARAAEVFDDVEIALAWLKTPIAALGDGTPLRLVNTDIGADSVMDTLGRIEHGVFA